MKIEKNNRLPQNSLLNQNNSIFDFVETYYTTTKKPEIDLNELVSSYFESIPQLVKWLLNFKMEKEMLDGSKISYSEGDIFGPFHIFRIVSYEIILGINTNHLDYRISLSIEKNKYYRLCFCTVITINNLWGKIHLNIFRKIYRLATLRTLQRMARRF